MQFNVTTGKWASASDSPFIFNQSLKQNRLNGVLSMEGAPENGGDDIFVKDILDGRFESPKGAMVDKILHLVKMAFECRNSSPNQRPSMRDVAKFLAITDKISRKAKCISTI